MKKIEVPITTNFDKNQIGICIIDKDKLIYTDHYHFEPGLRIIEKEETKDGRIIIKKAELIEISLVPTRHQGKPIPISKTWSRKGNCSVCGAGTGCRHRDGCIYKKRETRNNS